MDLKSQLGVFECLPELCFAVSVGHCAKYYFLTRNHHFLEISSTTFDKKSQMTCKPPPKNACPPTHKMTSKTTKKCMPSYQKRPAKPPKMHFGYFSLLFDVQNGQLFYMFTVTLYVYMNARVSTSVHNNFQKFNFGIFEFLKIIIHV